MDRKLTFILIGVVFWVVAAVFMHFIGPYVFDGGLIHIGFWIANFFLPILVLPLFASMTGRTKHQMLAPTALIALPAMTLDGLSITLDTMGKTHIYADSPQLAGLTGGFLLFAFMGFFFWALVWHKS